MIKGTYRFSSNGEVIAEVENMLTTNGLLAINSFLAGSTRSWAGTLAIGALNTASTTASSTVLQYELARYPVSFVAYQTSGSINQQVIKTTIDPSTDFEIYELGIFPAQVNVNSYADNFKITNFSETSGSVSSWAYFSGSSVTTSSANPLIARSSGLFVVVPVTSASATNSASIGGLTVDSSAYTSNDYLSLLYFTSASTNASAVNVTFGDSTASAQNIWSSVAVSGSTSASGFYSASMTMGAKPANWLDPIISASITVAGTTGSAYLDHLKFVQNQILTSDFQLVSRAISSSSTVPLISKIYGSPLDIEYDIQVT